MLTPAAAMARYMASVPMSIHFRLSASARPNHRMKRTRARNGTKRIRSPWRRYSGRTPCPGAPRISSTSPVSRGSVSARTTCLSDLLYGGRAEDAGRAHDQDEQEDHEDDDRSPAPTFRCDGAD